MCAGGASSALPLTVCLLMQPHAWWEHPLAHIQSHTHQNPWPFQQQGHSPSLCWYWCYLRYWAWHRSCRTALAFYCLHPQKFLKTTTAPAPKFSANCIFAKGASSSSASSSKLLMKIMNNTSPRNNPWGASLSSWCEVDIWIVITTLRSWQFRWFSVHLAACLSGPYLSPASKRECHGRSCQKLF